MAATALTLASSMKQGTETQLRINKQRLPYDDLDKECWTKNL